jgi:DNA-binding transcriptional ArsR family regulator
MKNKEASEVLKALAHPTRLEIVAGLMKNECSVAEIQKKLGIPQSTISQHLRVLRSNGIIEARQDGSRRCYSVVDSRAREVVAVMRGEA